MENIVHFRKMFEAQEAGVEAAPPIFGEIDFTVSGVSDDAMKLIAGLMAKSVLVSGEAERIAKMADTNPASAASYLQQRIEGILNDVPGIDPGFISQIKSQAPKLAKSMVEAIPMVLGNISQTDIDTSKELRPDPSKASFFSKLGDIFNPEQ
jgi:hypothetical protein